MEPGTPPPLALARNRRFVLLWTGHVFSSFGDALTAFALLLIVYGYTESTPAVALAAAVIALPTLLIGPLAGVFVDRWRPRRVMVASDLLRAPLVLGLVAVTSEDRLWLLYVLAFVQAAVGTFFNPARTTLLAQIVPLGQLLSANSISEMSKVVAGVAGVAVAGWLASFGVDLRLVFAFDAITFLVSGLCIGLIAQPAAARASVAAGSVLCEFRQGLRVVFASGALLGVIVVGALVMLGVGAVNVLLVPFVLDDLGASEAWFGPLEGAYVSAMVLSGIAVSVLATALRPTRLVSLGAMALGGAIAAIALTSHPGQLTLLLFGAGLCVPPIQASVTTLMQTSITEEFRGRAIAAGAALLSAANLASISLSGLIAGAVGVRTVFILCGLVVVGAGALSLALSRLPRATNSTPVVEDRA